MRFGETLLYVVVQFHPWLKFYFPTLEDMAVYSYEFNGMADSCARSLDLYLIFGYMTANFMCFSVPTLHSCCLWIDTIVW